MRPNDNENQRPQAPIVPARPASSLNNLSSRESEQHYSQNTNAAANVARHQLDSIYSGNTSTPTPQTTPSPQPDQEQAPNQTLTHRNPYERTHSSHVSVQDDQWKQYHSAWQQYYQKYYERYYVGEVHKVHQAIQATNAQKDSEPQQETPQPEQSVSKDEAMFDLRHKLLASVKNSAKKARKSRHFVPISAALCVMVLFAFLQYNRVLFANVHAYISPGNIDPVNIIVDPAATVAVSPEPKLIIPKINVDVPVVYNTTPDHDSQMKAMENGVAWFGIPGANSKPGQVGNTVLSGHSSNDVLDGGDYKFIFAQLDRLQNGDLIYLNYKGTRYTYTVTKTEVVKPTEVSKLVYDTKKPMLTLITCTPLGTSLNRLLVTAEQVSPSPNTAEKAPKNEPDQTADMPGNSPTFVERLFGR